jgi:hypothetical protein
LPPGRQSRAPYFNCHRLDTPFSTCFIVLPALSAS